MGFAPPVLYVTIKITPASKATYSPPSIKTFEGWLCTRRKIKVRVCCAYLCFLLAAPQLYAKAGRPRKGDGWQPPKYEVDGSLVPLSFPRSMSLHALSREQESRMFCCGLPAPTKLHAKAGHPGLSSSQIRSKFFQIRVRLDQ